VDLAPRGRGIKARKFQIQCAKIVALADQSRTENLCVPGGGRLKPPYQIGVCA
jgi:hypothetical protein